jgi:hypothetical protein
MGELLRFRAQVELESPFTVCRVNLPGPAVAHGNAFFHIPFLEDIRRICK